MPRALRNRHPVNYAKLVHGDIADGEPSSQPALDDDESSGSEFEPENIEETADATQEDAEVNETGDGATEEENQAEAPPGPIKRGRGRPRKEPIPPDGLADGPAPVKRGRGRPRKHPLPPEGVVLKPSKRYTLTDVSQAEAMALGPHHYTRPKSKTFGRLAKPIPTRKVSGLSGYLPAAATKRQQYVLPAPRVHQRHHVMPLFWRSGRVERLVSKPVLFAEPQTEQTWNFTHSVGVVNRVTKSWTHNIGNGPVWDAIEDRAWFKEGTEMEREATRRPRVHRDVTVRSGLQLMDMEEASSWLPTDDVTTDDGLLQPPPPVICSFGPYGSQQKLSVPMFASINMSTLFPESESHVFNAGGPVWSIDWCPLHIDSRHTRGNKQYLALSPYPSNTFQPEVGVKVSRPSKACIQIWSLQAEVGMMCEMVVCHDSGVANELKWCPLPSHDSWPAEDESIVRKLGLLAGTFHDGSFSVYVIPDPEDVRPEGHDPSLPVFVKLNHPLIRIEHEECTCWCFDWANSELVAVGTSTGVIVIYNLSSPLKSPAAFDSTSPTITGDDILPSHYIHAHQSGIRSLTWIRVPPSYPSGEPRTDADPSVIASGGYDGLEIITDLRDGLASILNRTRDVINTITYSIHASGPISIDHDNTVKSFSLSPLLLGRGHSLVDPMGPVWSIHTSDYHPQIAVGSADGTCITTNVLRAQRRGGPTPFLAHKIFQLDYSRTEGEFRMLERFYPFEIKDRSANARKENAAEDYHGTSTGAWSSCISVTRVAWNSGNGLSAAGLLASATASGLCRVDNLWGRWARDQVPYGGVETMRFEDDPNGGADEDSEEDDEGSDS